MSVTIIACPSCKALVLPDTAQCPNCHFVLDEKRAAGEAHQPPAAQEPAPEEEIPCPGCNELVRKGLVRCWNCGTFMRPEIAETYRNKQGIPQPVIYSEVDESSGRGATGTLQTDRPGKQGQAPAPPTIDDEDFQISDELGVDLEGDFDLGATAPPSVANEILESAPTYVLRPDSSDGENSSGGTQSAEPGADTKTGDSKEAQPNSFVNDFESRFGTDDSPGASGEVLLRVALAEEAEVGARRRNQKEAAARSGFKVYCPNGHRIEVQERHRGLTGRCPRCRETFVVPANTWDEERKQQQEEAQEASDGAAEVRAGSSAGADHPSEISAGEYTRWMLDCHLHVVDLTKLKLKSGSLVKDFQEADIGFSPDGILIVQLMKKGGLFAAAGPKKKQSTRDAVLEHLSKGKARDEVPAANRQFVAAADISQIRIVQPILSSEQSMFAGVPVFGEGRIAVRLPKKEQSTNPEFLSFGLFDFRRFSRILNEFYGIDGFGAANGIPLEDAFSERYCHFSDQPLKILENLEFYKDDPGFKIKKIGYKCAGCGLVVSEESREKEKIGGKDGKKIAKAKCPKCQKPFGDLPLFSLDVPAAT